MSPWSEVYLQTSCPGSLVDVVLTEKEYFQAGFFMEQASEVEGEIFVWQVLVYSL